MDHSVPQLGKATGRPSKFSAAVANQIIERLKAGQTLEAAGKSLGIHRSALKRWLSMGSHASDGPYRKFFDAYRKIRGSNGSEPVKSVGGRPLKPIDEKKVRKMASMGLSLEQIAAISECNIDTLSDRFSEVIKKGREVRNGRLMSELFRRAMAGKSDSGSQTCLIFACKAWCGMYDRPPESNLAGNGDSILRYLAEVRQQFHLQSPNGKEITVPERLEIGHSLDIDSDGASLDRDEPTDSNSHSELAQIPEEIVTQTNAPLG
jgi:hypothetical protein